MTPRRALLLLAALLCARLAQAQNTIALGALTVEPTLASAGVVLTTTGDDNSNARVHIEWRPVGAPGFQVGHALMRIAGWRFAAVVLGPTPDTAVELRAVADDPDPTVLTDAVRPLVVYQIDRWPSVCGSLRLAKSAGRIRIDCAP